MEIQNAVCKQHCLTSFMIPTKQQFIYQKCVTLWPCLEHSSGNIKCCIISFHLGRAMKMCLGSYADSEGPDQAAQMHGQWRPRSDCAFAQSDQGLHCPLTEFFFFFLENTLFSLSIWCLVGRGGPSHDV